MEPLISFAISPWIIGTGTAVIAGLVLYYGFRIGKEQQVTKNEQSPFVSAGRNVIAGRDIIVGPKPPIKKEKTKLNNKLSNRIIILTPSERRKFISLPIEIMTFSKVTSQISLSNAENTTWRIGYILKKEGQPKKEYVFHVYQDNGGNTFHSRIVEIEPGVREINPDYQKHDIGVEDTKKFKLVVERRNEEIFFYVDDILLGKYRVPFKEIDDLSIGVWSHKDHLPITVSIKNIRWI